IVELWAGRSKNSLAQSQLHGARTYNDPNPGFPTAGYIFLNFDDQVCGTPCYPLRRETVQELNGLTSAQWQVDQGIAAAGSEFSRLSINSIDVGCIDEP